MKTPTRRRRAHFNLHSFLIQSVGRFISLALVGAAVIAEILRRVILLFL